MLQGGREERDAENKRSRKLRELHISSSSCPQGMADFNILIDAPQMSAVYVRPVKKYAQEDCSQVLWGPTTRYTQKHTL